MKKLACVLLLASAFAVPAAAQDSNAARAQREGGQATEKAARQKAKEGQDCDTNRAGVRCSRPKPKKVWFWGKA
jgi:uncharacterized low-complexity protein